MFWQKIESYSKLLFLLLLLFTQALVFVAVGARDKQEYLSLAFVEPMTAYLPADNEAFFWEAYIEGPQGQQDFSLVYFSVVNHDLGYEMNFNAQLTNTDTWRALASWNVREVPSSQYLVLAKAHLYQDGKWQIYQSQPQIFAIEGNYQAALELDIGDNKTISEEQEEQGSSQPISEPEEEEIVEEVILSGSINAPLAGKDNSGDLLLQISLNRQLDINKGEGIILAKIDNQENVSSFSFNLTTDTEGLVYSRSIDTTLLEEGVLLYPNGAYRCEFVVLDNNNQELFSLGSVDFVINNQVAEEPEEPEEELANLMLLSPLPGEPIMEKSFTLNLDTPLYSSGVRAQFYNQSDPAISTGDIVIPYFDGHNWTRVIYLDDSFVNGNYILNISLLDESNLTTYTESFNFLLTLGSNEFLFDPDTIEFRLINLETNISGTVFPVILSSFDFSSADVYLEIISSINQEEKVSLPLARAVWETLAAWGFKQSDYSSTPYAYLATFDTGRLTNGNYRLLVKNNLNPEFSSSEKLVSIFNSTDTKDEAEDLEESATDQIETDLIDGQPASSVILSEASRMNKKLLIYQNESCADLGIREENFCQHFIATTQFLDQRCLGQSIFDALACEDYLRRTKVDLECQVEGIFEPERCKDYLLEKYAGAVDCRLADSLLCADILRNKQLNRLVVAKNNQVEIENIIEPLFGQTVSTQELGQKIENVGLDKNLLSLAPQQETKVFLAKAASQAILYNEDILTVVSGGLMMLDSDGDGLPDDLEFYYGTDPFNPDTDGDGYLDGLEVINGYNPLGQGPLLQERLFFDQLLFDQVPLEQPQLSSSRISDDLVLANLENLQDSLRLSGQAEADTWILLYLYSDLPMVMLTKTDASGNWSYNLERPLNDGYHKAYVAVNDNTGRIVSQSRPFSFFVKQSRAVSADEYFDISLAPDRAQSFLVYYIAGGALLLLLVLGIIIILRKGKKTESEI